MSSPKSCPMMVLLPVAARADGLDALRRLILPIGCDRPDVRPIPYTAGKVDSANGVATRGKEKASDAGNIGGNEKENTVILSRFW